MCNTEFPLVQLLKGGEETSRRVIKAGGSLPTIAIGLPTTKAACPPPGLCPYQHLLPPTCCVTLQQTPKTNTQIYIDSNTQLYVFKYTNIHGFKYTNNWTTMVALASIVSVSLVVLSKLTLQNIEYFSIRTLWASLATKNPHHLFDDSLADSH